MTRLAVLTVLASLLAACVPITPVPAPGPSPVDAAPPLPDDPLAGAVFNCEASWVELERPSIATPVEECAAGEPDLVAPCLSQIATSKAHPDTVGCEAEDRGARASAAVAKGTATAVDQRIAENVRAWIRRLRVSFR